MLIDVLIDVLIIVMIVVLLVVLIAVLIDVLIDLLFDILIAGFCGANTLHKTISTTFFLYFACILPAIALGVLNYNNTGGKMGNYSLRPCAFVQPYICKRNSKVKVNLKFIWRPHKQETEVT